MVNVLPKIIKELSKRKPEPEKPERKREFRVIIKDLDIIAALKRCAEYNGRSMTAQAIVLIHEGLRNHSYMPIKRPRTLESIRKITTLAEGESK